MARAIEVIQKQMFDNIAANADLAGLNSTSKTALYRLLVFVFAYAVWVLETLFDIHKSEVADTIYNQKSGTLPWYRTMALAFQYGFALLPDSDKFDNSAATETQIDDSKVIKYAAVSESSETSRVILKIAGETAGVLSPLAPEVYDAFTAYVEEYRYAGVEVTVINYLPDRLFLNIIIKRDPLQLDANGMNILFANYPINDALSAFMKELPFNGELHLSALVDQLQKVPGVIDATLISANSSWIDPTVGGYGIPQPIFISKLPVSGYFEIQGFDNVNYVV